MDFKLKLAPSGVCINGCLPATDETRKLQANLSKSAVPIDLLWNEKGEVPIIADDSEFDRFIEQRTEYFDSRRKKGIYMHFWQIYRDFLAADIMTDRLIWNQKQIPSCCLTATSHAIQAATLINAGIGAPIKYDAINPIYAHYKSTGQMGVGQDLTTAGEFINKNGVYPASDVGEDNISRPDDVDLYTDAAQRNRVAVCFIDDTSVDNIFRLAKAGLCLVFGSSQFYDGAELDSNGMRCGSSLTSGAHAETCTGYNCINGKEYVYIQNSHGDIYGTDSTNKPASGYWLTKESIKVMSRSFGNYGNPFVVFPHSEVGELTLVPLEMER